MYVNLNIFVYLLKCGTGCYNANVVDHANCP